MVEGRVTLSKLEITLRAENSLRSHREVSASNVDQWIPSSHHLRRHPRSHGHAHLLAGLSFHCEAVSHPQFRILFLALGICYMIPLFILLEGYFPFFPCIFWSSQVSEFIAISGCQFHSFS